MARGRRPDWFLVILCATYIGIVLVVTGLRLSVFHIGIVLFGLVIWYELRWIVRRGKANRRKAVNAAAATGCAAEES